MNNMWSKLRGNRRIILLGSSTLTASILAYNTDDQDKQNIINALRSLFPNAVVYANSFLTNNILAREDERDDMVLTTRFYSTNWDDNWDRRKVDSLSEGVNKKEVREGGEGERGKRVVRHLYLIRHGQYVNAKEDKDRVLSELGRIQADITGRRFANMAVNFHRLHHSTMARATETALLMHHHLPTLGTSSSSLLCEGAPIPPIPKTLSSWRPDEADFFVDGARMEAAFRQYFYRPYPTQDKNTHEIIVCHSNIIRYFVCRALQIPPEMWGRMSLGHCSITRVDMFHDGRVSIRSIGDVGHLAPEQQSLVRWRSPEEIEERRRRRKEREKSMKVMDNVETGKI